MPTKSHVPKHALMTHHRHTLPIPALVTLNWQKGSLTMEGIQNSCLQQHTPLLLTGTDSHQSMPSLFLFTIEVSLTTVLCLQ